MSESAPPRSATWPPTARDFPLHRRCVGDISSDPDARSTSSSALPLAHPAIRHDDLAFELDLNKHPDSYFITPPEAAMEYRYQYDWDADDSDDDDDDPDDDFEWDAGITDFALFDNDRRAAQEAHRELPSRWNEMLSSQTSALQRAAQRSHDAAEPNRHSTSSPTADENLPGLTPDHSPHLHDEWELDHSPPTGSLPVPNYLTITVTPPAEDGRVVFDDADMDDQDAVRAARWGQRSRKNSASRPLPPQRPGLRNARTMSGKAHSWRRPDHDIYPVGEDADAERRAELDSPQHEDEE
nr:hypothetical protein CFP56_31556 [Quercus suber]